MVGVWEHPSPIPTPMPQACGSTPAYPYPNAPGVWEHLDDLTVVELLAGFRAQGKPAHLACTNLIAR